MEAIKMEKSRKIFLHARRATKTNNVRPSSPAGQPESVRPSDPTDQSDSVRPFGQSVPSLFAVAEKVKKQIDYKSFTKEYVDKKTGEIISCHNPILDDICYTIAEIYVIYITNPFSEIKINGTEAAVFVVNEVYGKLDFVLIERILEKLGRVDSIRNKRAYLRTVLYNSVFESGMQTFGH
jgi:hypothetical protein